MTPLEIINIFATSTKVQAQIGSITLEEALSFSLSKTLLTHSRFNQAITQIAELHHHCKQNRVGKGYMVIGPSGVGKSTVLNFYWKYFPIIHAKQKTIIPVLFILSPSAPSASNLAEAILLALGDPLAKRRSKSSTGEYFTNRVYELLLACEVEMILIDEVQHVSHVPSIFHYRVVTDWLKNMIEKTRIPVVIFGLEASELVVKSSEQLSRRFSSQLKISAFNLNDDQDFIEFRAVMKGLQEALPLSVAEPLYEANLARRFLVASNGLLGYLCPILEEAVVVATKAGLNQLDMQTYAAAFRNKVWSLVPDRLNPFHPESPLRMLNRPGEPYCAEDKLVHIGTPLASRHINKPPKKE
ncbi:MAG: TniB family NTP-binding protein [Methylotenera sp.]|nr:TniB family NTP-binding protein [Methylotenera sp.]